VVSADVHVVVVVSRLDIKLTRSLRRLLEDPVGVELDVVAEIMPNIANPLIVVATIEMAHAILLEAALSFLGLGVQPPEPSWGLMIAEAKGLMFFDAWLIAIPGAALFMLVLSINLLGDGVRDVTAPDGRN
jgi:peptide/nickel transport system permease protein